MRARLGLALASILACGPPGATRAGSATVAPGYSAERIRAIDIFGVRLSMPLAEAEAALVRRGFKGFRYPARLTTDREGQVLWAEYRHPRQNTTVGLFYAQLPKGERRISEVVLWEEIPVMPRADFGRFLARRYGTPTRVERFQGHDAYSWSQRPLPERARLSSIQCLRMHCLPRELVGQCNGRTISDQVVMSGEFNTNMAGKLYWTAVLADLPLQRKVLLRGGRIPARSVCPPPAI